MLLSFSFFLWVHLFFYRPQRSCSQRGCLPQCMLGYTTTPRADTPLARHPPPEDRHPSPGRPPADGYCSGRYASYWNAFLFSLFFRIVHLKLLKVCTWSWYLKDSETCIVLVRSINKSTFSYLNTLIVVLGSEPSTSKVIFSPTFSLIYLSSEMLSLLNIKRCKWSINPPFHLIPFSLIRQHLKNCPWNAMDYFWTAPFHETDPTCKYEASQRQCRMPAPSR